MLVFLLPRPSGVLEIEISQVFRMAEKDQISKIVVRGDKIDVIAVTGKTFKSRKESSVSILEVLEQRGVETGDDGIQVEVKKEGSSFFGIFLTFLPLIIFGGFILYMIRGARGGINQAMQIGRSRARLVTENRPNVTFDDVAGAEEAKQELAEIVEFLRYPEKFAKLGAKIPRGVLMAGAPGPARP